MVELFGFGFYEMINLVEGKLSVIIVDIISIFYPATMNILLIFLVDNIDGLFHMDVSICIFFFLSIVDVIINSISPTGNYRLKFSQKAKHLFYKGINHLYCLLKDLDVLSFSEVKFHDLYSGLLRWGSAHDDFDFVIFEFVNRRHPATNALLLALKFYFLSFCNHVPDSNPHKLPIFGLDKLIIKVQVVMLLKLIEGILDTV